MIPWRREWQPNPVFLSGEFRGQSSLASYGAWGYKKSDMTEQLTYIHTVVKNLPANEGDLRDLMACSIKNPPTMQETWVQSLGQEDPLEEGKTTIRVVSSAYLRLLIFLLAILIPVCASSSPAFLMMYSAYKLNKQGDNIQP